MKKFLSIMIIITLLIIPLCGCKKLISKEYKEVEVVVIDKYYRAMYITPMKVGKVTMMQTHPAKYRITVKYNDVKYTLNGKKTYDKYKDKVGETVIGVLEIRTYDDGTIKYDITELKGGI